MRNLVQRIKYWLSIPNSEIRLPRKCYVYGCEFEEGTIYCGVKKEGLLVREGRKYWVLIDGNLRRYEKKCVFFE